MEKEFNQEDPLRQGERQNFSTLKAFKLEDLTASEVARVLGKSGDPDKIKEYLDEHKFDIKQTPAEDDAILFVGESEIGSRGNILTITGREKSRKTVIASAIASALLHKDKVFLNINGELNDNDCILHLDTEQGYKHYYNGVTRIFDNAGLEKGVTPGNFHSYQTRDADIGFRLEILEYILPVLNPAVVIIDGVTDLVYDINSQEEAVRVGEKILRWSSVYNALFVCVIHTTKTTGYMTGAIGTYLSKKCETSIKVEVPEDNDKISNVICQNSRNYPFDPFTIEFNKELGHYVVADEHHVPTKGAKGKKDPEKYADQIHSDVLQRIFLISDTIPRDSFERKLISAVKECTSDELPKRTAQRWIKYYAETKTLIYADPEGLYRRVIPTASSDDLPF